MRRQESAQEPCGSWRLCSLPRSHLGHPQEYVRTNGPWIADSGSCGAGKRPVRSPRFSVVRSDRGPCSLAGDSPPSRTGDGVPWPDLCGAACRG